MNLEYFIAGRTSGGSRSIMTRVATIAVAVGVVVMIITMAVIAGFKVQIADKLSGLSGHIIVTDAVGVNPSSLIPIERSEELEQLLEQSGAQRYSTYILRGAIARGGGEITGVVVKGVDSLYNSQFFEHSLTSGQLPKFGEPQARREVLLSQGLADDMSLSVGERMELIFTDEEGDISRFTFKVTGLFSAGVGEQEHSLILADIETLRRVNNWQEPQVSGYEVWIDNIDNAEPMAQQLNHSILYETEQSRVVAISLEEIYPMLFDWLRTHDLNGLVVGIIMLIVAIFNMATALLILVLESSRMVGILKSLGMANGALRQIFLYRALWITVRGLAWGNVIGLVLCLAQSRWGVLKLEASGYILSQVPIELNAGWILALNMGFVAVVLLVMTIPARMVASISPDEIVKYR